MLKDIKEIVPESKVKTYEDIIKIVEKFGKAEEKQ